jgi:hypothetical protein
MPVKNIFSSLVRNQSGQGILPIVLILVILGALILGPLLALMSAGLKAGQMHENKTQRYYAADSGIEDGWWQINNGKLPSSYDYDYYSSYSYSLDSTVNDKDVDIAIQNVWIPKDLTTAPVATTAEQIIKKGKLLTFGNCIIEGDASSRYQIKAVYYYGDSDSTGQNLKVQQIGVWLPPGFHYVSGTSSLETGGPSKPYYPSSVQITPWKSGEAVVWTFSSLPKFRDFPSISGTFTLPDANDAFTITGGAVADSGTITKTAGTISVTAAGGATYSSSTGAWTTPAGGGTIVVKASAAGTVVSWYSTKASATAIVTTDTDGDVTTGYPLVRSFSFTFDPPVQSDDARCWAAVSWINTANVSDLVPGYSGITYTWDADKKVYKINSTATDAMGKETEVNAYAAKMEARQLGSCVVGDYVAIGNSLLTPTGDVNYRNRLYKESSATIPTGSIPAGATIEYAYLYWVGWIDYHYWKATSYHGRTTWSWDSIGIPELNYNNYPSNPSQLIANAKVNTVSFGGGGTTQDITASYWQVIESTDSPGEHVWDGTWSYTCFYDATDIVKPLIEGQGTSTFTFGHASQGGTSVINLLRSGYPGVPGGTAPGNYYSFTLYNTSSYTGYPLGFPAMKLPSGESSYQERYIYAYCGWSLIIIYSSPGDSEKHQLYLYDIKNPDFKFKEAWAPGGIPNPDFDGDGTGGGTMSGFIVPQQIIGETNAARMTCFVGEGDQGITGDYFKVTGPSGSWANLSDGTSPYNTNNVWNSKSVDLAVPGIDIDTFYVTWSSQILRPGDTSAQIDLTTGNDGFTLVYIILSFRSSVTFGGTLSYLIMG